MQIILKWVKEDIKSRIHNLEPLLAKLDLKLFSIEFLEKIKNNMLVTDRIQQRVEDIIGYKTARGLLNQMIDSEATYSFHKFRHKAEKAVSNGFIYIYTYIHNIYTPTLFITISCGTVIYISKIKILGDTCYWWRVKWNGITKC